MRCYSPPKLLVSGYYGFDNMGDEAVLAGICELIRGLSPDAEITVLSGNPARTEALHGTKAVPRMSLRHIWNALGDCDLFVSGGGSLFQDSTSLRTVPYYAAMVKLAAMRRVPCMMYAQGVGPLTAGISRTILAGIRRDFSVITVRDPGSAGLLQTLGYGSESIGVTVDPVFGLGYCGREEAMGLLADEGIPTGKGHIGVSVRDLPRGFDTGPVVGLIEWVLANTDSDVLMLPFHVPDDLRLSDSIKEACGSDRVRVLRNHYTPQRFLGIVGCMGMVVGMRLHSLIFAARTSVPFIGVSYDPKVTGLCSAFDAPCLDAGALDRDGLVGAVAGLYADGAGYRERLAQKVGPMSGMALETARTALGLALRQRNDKERNE